jgi:endonuclease-3 related protein
MRLTGKRLERLYDALYRTYGRQHWWKADTAFEVMVGAVLVQNTSWQSNAALAIAELKRRKLLTPAKIAALPTAQLARHIRSSGTHGVKARRLKALSRWLLDRGGVKKAEKLPTDELRRSLLAVHGIGPETTDCILLYAFARPVFVADAYARRLLGRLGFELDSEGYEMVRAQVETVFSADAKAYNEFHALIVRHCKRVCRATPDCGHCVLRRRCAFATRRPWNSATPQL